MFVDRRSNIRFIEPMVLGAMKSHGTFDDSHLISSIRRREIAAFVFGPEGLNLEWRGRKFFWPELRDAIEANYDKLSSACVPVVMMPKRSSK